VQYRQIDLGFRPSRGPASWLAILLGIIGLTVAIALGVVFFTLFLGIVLVAAAILGVRIWWIRRRFLKQGLGAGFERRFDRGQTGTGGHGTTLEGEYRVLDEGDTDAGRRGGNQ
jgi:hypothetical protein